MLNVRDRNNVAVKGNGRSAIMFAHGFGSDQSAWRLVAPAFERTHKTILFDHVGAGKSDVTAYSHEKYGTLEGYASDIVEILRDLGLSDVVFVGHSVSSMMGILASRQAPGLFRSLVLVGPSPCYINNGNYVGGFTLEQIEDILASLEGSKDQWSSSMAPIIMKNNHRPELAREIEQTIRSIDPKIANHFARTTFLTDSRELLESVNIPTLILQCRDDAIAPEYVGEYMRAKIKNSKLVLMKATGHCPSLSAPAETIAEIRSFL